MRFNILNDPNLYADDSFYKYLYTKLAINL